MKPATRLAAIVCGLVALAHLLRLLMGFDLMVAGWTVPLWLSGVAFLAFGALAYFVYRENTP